MGFPAHRRIAWQNIRLTGLLFFLCVLLPLPGSAVASQLPTQVTLGPAIGTRASTVYRLRVRAEGSPVLAVLPDELHFAQLVVNGAIVQRAGRDVDIGTYPFGHAASAFRLSGLTPNDRIEIRMRGGGTAPPVIVSDLAHAATAFDSGFWSGIGYGVLLTLVLFQLVTACAVRDPTLLWYVLWIASVVGLQLTRDDILPLHQAASANFNTLLILDVVGLFGYVGFAATYLKLIEQAPRLFWCFIASTIAAVAAPGLAGAITHEAPALDVILLSNAVPMAVGMLAAGLRRRAGFMPASYLALGLIGTLVLFVGRPLRDFTGIESPFLDRWAVEICSVFDYLVFSLGIACRFRFTHREHERLKVELRATSIVAGRDSLTGLLNRRGLEEWVAGFEPLRGTVLYIDVDGFKAVNDAGGHAAGDDTLAVVAQIIRSFVREQDAVARFGGDEFVVVLPDCNEGELTQAIIERISSGVDGLMPLGANSGIRIGVSIGSAALDEHLPFSEALKRADADGYRIKHLHHAEQSELPRPATGATASCGR